MTKLMIAAAMMAAAAGTAPALTTTNGRSTLDYKTMADIQRGATHEQRLDKELRTFGESNLHSPLSRKHPDAPVILVAPTGSCPDCRLGSTLSTWQQIQRYLQLPFSIL
jgi:hypothetical protein